MNVGSLIKWLIIILVGYWLYNTFFNKEDSWTAFVYFERGSYAYADQVTQPGLKSLLECRQWVADYRASGRSYFDHECGLNCHPSDTFDRVTSCDQFIK